MNTETIFIVVLGVTSLLLAVGLVALVRARSQSDQGYKAEVATLQTKVNDIAKFEGQVAELNRSLQAAREDKSSVEQALQTEQNRSRSLTDELATARTESQGAKDAATQQVAQERDNCATAIHREKEACAALIKKEKEACAEVIAAKDVQIDRLAEFIDKANETLGTEFKALSQETLKDISAQFQRAAEAVIEQNSEKTVQDVRLHKQQIENLLQPMGQTLKRLDEQVKDTNEKRGEAEAVLMSKIQDFAGANEKLANALSKPVIRGSFAEVKLESLLEAAGLVRGENFELQVTVKDGDQTRIVDALVNMAQGKKLVIDSKNLLVPFVEYANAPDGEKVDRLADFQRAFRTTVKALGLKDYAKHWEGVDAVIMFLPDEGMYMAALETDRQLIATMFEHRVFVVSPVSLLPILKSVAYILGLEKQNRDTQEIVEAGRSLYESLGVILDKVKRLGGKLEDGVEAYNGVIASFEGNVLPKTRALRAIGIHRGAAHKDVAAIDPQFREFKGRVVKELAIATSEHPADEVHE